MARTLRGHLRPEDPLNITVIPTWVDAEFIRPMNKAENPLIRRHGLEGRFVVMYCGNFGATHDLTSLIDAAELLLDCPDVFFVLIGGGTRVREVTASVAQRKLRNLALLPFQSSEHLPYWLAAADCAVVCLDEAFVGVSMPSKTYFAMAAGSALVAVSPPGTDLAAVVQAAGCGIHVPPRNAKALADAFAGCATTPHTSNSARSTPGGQRFVSSIARGSCNGSPITCWRRSPGRGLPVGHATRGQPS